MRFHLKYELDTNAAPNRRSSKIIAMQHCVTSCPKEQRELLSRLKPCALFAWSAILLSIMLLGSSLTSQAQQTANSHSQVRVLIDAGRLAEAQPLAEQALREAESQASIRAETGIVPQALTEAAKNLGQISAGLGDFANAETYLLRALALSHNDNAQIPVNILNVHELLADMYRQKGDFAATERHLRVALSILENANIVPKIRLANAFRRLGELLQTTSREQDAIPFFARAKELLLDVMSAGAVTDRHVQAEAQALLANALHDQRQFTEAESTYRQLLLDGGPALGLGHPLMLRAMDRLGHLYRQQGQFSQARPLLEGAVANREQNIRRNEVEFGSAVANLAEVYRQLGLYDKAEAAYIRSVTIREKALGLEHWVNAYSYNQLGRLNISQGRYLEAEKNLNRGLVLREQGLGTIHPLVAQSLYNLAVLYEDLRRHEDAERLQRRALEIRERRLGRDHLATGYSLNHLGLILLSQNKTKEAVEILNRSLALRLSGRGPDHFDTVDSLEALALAHLQLGNAAESEALFARALALNEKIFGLRHQRVAKCLEGLAKALLGGGQFDAASEVIRRAIGIREEHAKTGPMDLVRSLEISASIALGRGEALDAALISERGLKIWSEQPHARASSSENEISELVETSSGRPDRLIYALMNATYQFCGGAERQSELCNSLSERTFEFAQNVSRTAAETAIQRMAVRSAVGGGMLGILVRMRQDALGEWLGRERLRFEFVGRPPARRSTSEENANRLKLQELAQQIRQLDDEIARKFIDYGRHAEPDPVSLPTVQALLAPDEAALLFVRTERSATMAEHLYLWTITKTAVLWM